jgi:SNF2 family DNA or RNA helicase
MVPNTIKLADSFIKNGEKVIIATCYDEELNMLKDYYGDKCVVYNGKMTAKKKDEALKKFKEDENVMVFIGNLQSAGVGLNITEANVVIFNNVSFLPAENQQAEYRILRIGQEKDCYIIYQKFRNTYMDRMFEILDIKNEIIKNLIYENEN